MIHPENLFQPGDFIIAGGPSPVTGDRSFTNKPCLAVDDMGTHITLKTHLARRQFAIFIVDRASYPSWVKCSDGMLQHPDVEILLDPATKQYGAPSAAQ